MRWVVPLCLALVVGACGRRGDAQPAASAGSDNWAAENAREQAEFDAKRRPEKVVEAMKIGPGSHVADIGAGSGLLTVHLARAVAPNGKVVATDIDGRVLDYLMQRMRAAGLGNVVERRVVQPDTPGLEDGQYDAILLAEVDHYFTHPVQWLREATKALKPGGRIVISNRMYHRAQSLASARKAGLELVDESTPVPTHFIAVFVVPGAKP